TQNQSAKYSVVTATVVISLANFSRKVMARSRVKTQLHKRTEAIHRSPPHEKGQRRVGMTGIEPALLSELEPKSSASANLATSPWVDVRSGQQRYRRTQSVRRHSSIIFRHALH